MDPDTGALSEGSKTQKARPLNSRPNPNPSPNPSPTLGHCPRAARRRRRAATCLGVGARPRPGVRGSKTQ
eukprot:scaffold64476_cov51-Phaeocystis_antarctica.AAC.6